MATPRPNQWDEPITTLVAEIERWNQQINLVSRVRTRERVAALVAQCQAGWDLAEAALASVDWLADATYFDLGSGAGLPGLVWAAARAQGDHAGPAVLVEPRDKRAWFLRRTARLMGLEAVSVLPERWGDGEYSLASAGVLVSLKALRLDDASILKELARYQDAQAPPKEVAILRFLDPDQHSREWLEEAFAVPDAFGPGNWRRVAVESLGEGDPRLLLTRYSSA